MPSQYTFTTYPSTSASAIATRPVPASPAAITVRSSTDYNTSTATTDTSDVLATGAVGVILYVDQTAVAASSAGGGTATMTHTIQFKDPIGATYTGSTGVVTTSTGTGTWVLQCYPGVTAAAPTSGGVGKADMGITSIWRVRSSASSSATNFTYSVAAVYLPTAASSS